MGQRGVTGGWSVAAWVLTPLGLALLAGTVVYSVAHYKTVTIMGSSMRPTYTQGDRLFIERIDASEIRRGDVLLIEAPEHTPGGLVVRRVIGVGGDRVVGEGNRITVNGTPVHEPYVRDYEPNPTVTSYDVKVPDGRLFLLGDNRANSNDSRSHLSEQSGSIAASGVQGRVLEGSAVPTPWAALGGLGIVLALAGAGAHLVGRRARKQLPSRDPGPVVRA